MVATLCLLGCVLTSGQVTDRPVPPSPGATQPVRGGDWSLVPRLSPSQELVYRGSFSEEAKGAGLQFNRAYRVETRVFVLDTSPRDATVAFLTVLKHHDTRPNAPTVSSDSLACSVRLERARVDLQGRLTPESGVSLTVPLEGAPTLECALFVESPQGHVRLNQTWETTEESRPRRTWRAAGAEMVTGTSCLKLVGVQQSEDWDRPRADRTAWRRQDTVWIEPRLGIAYRVERIIERREPAAIEPTQKSILRYERESSLQYSGQLASDRRQDIAQASAFRASAAPLLPTPAKFGPQLNVLLNKITYYLDHQPPTPYREAVVQVKRRVEAAKRGESPVALPEDSPRSALVATIGEAAPDFVASEFPGPGTMRLRSWLGRPVLLVFYNPASSTANDLLRFAQKVSTNYAGKVAVVGLSVSDDADLVQVQRRSLELNIPVLHGSSLRVSYGIETTPKLVLLDANGIVRGAYLGWGRETSAEVIEELRRWLPAR
jgi:peroxiredoxin